MNKERLNDMIIGLWMLGKLNNFDGVDPKLVDESIDRMMNKFTPEEQETARRVARERLAKRAEERANPKPIKRGWWQWWKSR
jgi:hypothetical protein